MLDGAFPLDLNGSLALPKRERKLIKDFMEERSVS